MGSKKKRRVKKKRRSTKRESSACKDGRIQYLRVIRKRSRLTKEPLASNSALTTQSSNVSFRTGNPSIIPDGSNTRGSYSLSSERLQILLPTANRRPTRFPNRERNENERRSSIRQQGAINTYLHPDRRVSFDETEGEHQHSIQLLGEQSSPTQEDSRIVVALSGKIGPDTIPTPISLTQTQAEEGPLTNTETISRPTPAMAKIASITSKATRAIPKKKSPTVVRILYKVEPETTPAVKTAADAVKAAMVITKKSSATAKKTPTSAEPKATSKSAESKAAGKSAVPSVQTAAFKVKAALAISKQSASAKKATVGAAPATAKTAPPTGKKVSPMTTAGPAVAKTGFSATKPLPVTESQTSLKADRLSRSRRRIIALYKYYQREWRRFRQQIPGEAVRKMRIRRRKHRRIMEIN